jgi:hypothetical protein
LQTGDNDINRIPANASAAEYHLKNDKNHCQDHLRASDTGEGQSMGEGGAKDVLTFQT